MVYGNHGESSSVHPSLNPRHSLKTSYTKITKTPQSSSFSRKRLFFPWMATTITHAVLTASWAHMLHAPPQTTCQFVIKTLCFFSNSFQTQPICTPSLGSQFPMFSISTVPAFSKHPHQKSSHFCANPNVLSHPSHPTFHLILIYLYTKSCFATWYAAIPLFTALSYASFWYTAYESYTYTPWLAASHFSSCISLYVLLHPNLLWYEQLQTVICCYHRTDFFICSYVSHPPPRPHSHP